MIKTLLKNKGVFNIKRLSVILIVIFCMFMNSINIMAQNINGDVQAVWIATVYNLDFPKTKNNAEEQKKEFISYLDQLESIGINTVVVQVRPKSDAIYKSNINPWSDVLTGTQGKDPGYNPMEFMISQAHQRGMSFHAWLNPYRVTTSGTDVTALAQNHPARLNPGLTLSYNNALYYNPELQEVKQHIADTVKEIVANYDVDAIHFDDYFYPSNYPLPEGEAFDGEVANQRRQHVNDMVSLVSKTIKNTNPNVEFGISPVGIWKNNISDKNGSDTKGYEGYYSVYGDAITWINNGWVDYVVPQIYWEIGNKAADYDTLVKWWSDAVKGTNTKLYIGEGIYKDVVAEELTSHLKITENNDTVTGNFYYSLKNILENTGGVADAIKAYTSSNTNTNTNTNTNANTNTNTNTNDTQNNVTPQEKIKAVYNTSVIAINGVNVELEAYNIDGYNYFKLRDIAMLLRETGSKFDTVWDESSQSIDLVTGTKYTVSGGELSKGDGENKTALTSNAKIMLDGQSVQAQAYNINGNNYFKLRDLGDILKFQILWDDYRKAIHILVIN